MNKYSWGYAWQDKKGIHYFIEKQTDEGFEELHPDEIVELLNQKKVVINNYQLTTEEE